MPDIIEYRITNKAYAAQRKDMIDLQVDDEIENYQNAKNGWSQGKNVRTGKVGWYPTNYTEILEDYSYSDYSYSDPEEDGEVIAKKEIAQLQEEISASKVALKSYEDQIQEVKNATIESMDYQVDAAEDEQLLKEEKAFLEEEIEELNIKVSGAENELIIAQSELKDINGELDLAVKQNKQERSEKYYAAKEEELKETHEQAEALENEIKVLEEELDLKELASEEAVEYFELQREIHGLKRENELLKMKKENTLEEVLKLSLSEQ